MNVDINLLVALTALLEERQVTRAAQRVSMRQPAMSDCLRRLRRHYDDELLIRDGNRLELTPLGRSLLVRADNTAARNAYARWGRCPVARLQPFPDSPSTTP